MGGEDVLCFINVWCSVLQQRQKRMRRGVSTWGLDALNARVEQVYYSTMSGRLAYFVVFIFQGQLSQMTGIDYRGDGQNLRKRRLTCW
jgi:hypothetical protein